MTKNQLKLKGHFALKRNLLGKNRWRGKADWLSKPDYIGKPQPLASRYQIQRHLTFSHPADHLDVKIPTLGELHNIKFPPPTLIIRDQSGTNLMTSFWKNAAVARIELFVKSARRNHTLRYQRFVVFQRKFVALSKEVKLKHRFVSNPISKW